MLFLCVVSMAPPSDELLDEVSIFPFFWTRQYIPTYLQYFGFLLNKSPSINSFPASSVQAWCIMKMMMLPIETPFALHSAIENRKPVRENTNPSSVFYRPPKPQNLASKEVQCNLANNLLGFELHLPFL